jgi:hypothetical protein
MRKQLFVFALLFGMLEAYAEPMPRAVYKGYIEYPSRHEYRIDIFTSPSGLISRIATYSGEPVIKNEEMVISEKANVVYGEDMFQQSVKKITLTRHGDSIELICSLENAEARKKSSSHNRIRLRPKAGVLFEDDEVQCVLMNLSDFRIEPKKGADDPIVVRLNEIYQDGWYRSDWKAEHDRIVVREFTTMEIPGEWMPNGGGEYIGQALFSDDLAVNVMNYYILSLYIDSRVFLPSIFGLKTGSY